VCSIPATSNQPHDRPASRARLRATPRICSWTSNLAICSGEAAAASHRSRTRHPGGRGCGRAGVLPRLFKGGPSELSRDHTQCQPSPSGKRWRRFSRRASRTSRFRPRAVLVAGFAGACVGRHAPRHQRPFWLSGVGVGLGGGDSLNTCFAMFSGGFLFWLAGTDFQEAGSATNVVSCRSEPIAAG